MNSAFNIFYKKIRIISATPLSCLGPSVNLMICNPLDDQIMKTSPLFDLASCLSIAGIILPLATQPRSPCVDDSPPIEYALGQPLKTFLFIF